MKTFTVRIPFSGYVRGATTLSIQAESKEEAIEEATRWRFRGEDDITRDDREFDYEDATVSE
ncbi:hypothetical protein [Proteus phage J3S]